MTFDLPVFLDARTMIFRFIGITIPSVNIYVLCSIMHHLIILSSFSVMTLIHII